MRTGHWEVMPIEGKGREVGLGGAAIKLQVRPDELLVTAQCGAY